MISITSKNKNVVFIQGHNQRGKKLSEEHKTRIGKKLKGRQLPPLSSEHKKKISKARKGISWGNHSEESKGRIGQAQKGKFKSDEHKKNMSKASIKAWSEGRKTVQIYGKSGWSTPTTYNGIKMRSQLESKVAEQLDLEKIEWQYEPKRFNLGEFSYLPDFYLPEFNTWIEVKGYMTQIAQKKIDTFKQLDYNLIVIKKEDVSRVRDAIEKSVR